MDRRTFEAAAVILKEDIANLIIIGTPEQVAENSKGLDISGATIIDPNTYEKTQEYIDLFVELRKAKGLTPEKAKELMFKDYAYYGCLMIKNGDADGMVSGACHSTADTLRPCLQIIKTKSTSWPTGHPTRKPAPRPNRYAPQPSTSRNSVPLTNEPHHSNNLI